MHTVFDNEKVYKKRFDREFGEQLDLMSGLLQQNSGDIQGVLWDCDDMILVLFDYYASLQCDGRISSLTFNEWGMFVEDFGLHDSSSQTCQRQDLECAARKPHSRAHPSADAQAPH